MKPSIRIALICFLFGFFYSLDLSATDNGAPMELIRQNALLRTIYREDPEKAVRFTQELMSLAAKERSESPRPKTGEGMMKFRKKPPKNILDSRHQLSPEDQSDLARNPAIDDLYSRSPVASLRMLQRLRDAAGQTKK